MTTIDCTATNHEELNACIDYMKFTKKKKNVNVHSNGSVTATWTIASNYSKSLENKVNTLLMATSKEFPNATFEFSFEQSEVDEEDEEDYDDEMCISVTQTFKNGNKNESSFS